jgi:hypothetical protein
VQVPIIPFILRGDGEMVYLPREGYNQRWRFVYCSQATHTVQASSATSQFDFVARDPYERLWAAEDKALAARAKKRRQRKRGHHA